MFIDVFDTAPITRVRPAVVDDVSALSRVHLAAWIDAYRGICADAFLDALRVETFEGYHRPRFDAATGKPDEREPFFVACDDAGEVIGFSRGGPTRATSPTGDPLPSGFEKQFSGELYAIYVLPAHQSRGIGRQLFRVTMHRLVELGHRSLCLWVLSGNHVAREFYRRRGGREAGESHITLAGQTYPQVAYAWPDGASDAI